MRRMFLAAMTALAVVSGMTPAVGQVVEPTPPCETSDTYDRLGREGANENVTPSLRPAVGHDIAETDYDPASAVSYTYRFDVSGHPTIPDAKRGNLTFSLAWDNDSDYDLYVYDATGALLGESVNFNPLAGAGETVSLANVLHCTDLRIDIVNYLGLPPTMTLSTAVSGIKK